jgi:hypothetical protein
VTSSPGIPGIPGNVLEFANLSWNSWKSLGNRKIVLEFLENPEILTKLNLLLP